jgi:DNA-binding MarR family transcriptional regulator
MPAELSLRPGTSPLPRSRQRARGRGDRSTDVLVALRRIIRATDLHSKRLSKQAGFTTPQVVVLQAVRDLGEVTTGAISERVNLSQATVTTILDRLEGRGLVERYRSTADRRVVHARLTARGRATLRRAPSLLHERFIEAFARLSDADQTRIVATLDEVAGMMGAAELDAPPLLETDSPAPDL